LACLAELDSDQPCAYRKRLLTVPLTTLIPPNLRPLSSASTLFVKAISCSARSPLLTLNCAEAALQKFEKGRHESTTQSHPLSARSIPRLQLLTSELILCNSWPLKEALREGVAQGAAAAAQRNLATMNPRAVEFTRLSQNRPTTERPRQPMRPVRMDTR
jgi:hypothetical protein